MSKVRKFPSKEEEILELALRTKAKILGANYNPVAIVRSCYIIADGLSLNEDRSWLAFELNGYPETTSQTNLKVPQYRIIQLRSTFDSYPYYVRESIQQLAGSVKRRNPKTLTWNYSHYTLKPSQFESIIENVINRCLLYLNRVTTELQYGNAIEYLMEEIRKETDSKLSDFGEEMVAEAQSLYSSLNSDNPADWSKVGHSCRRMLEILADIVFPPRDGVFIGKDGNPHSVGQQQYINRLICFVEERIAGTERKLVIAEIEFFAAYIDCLKEDICSIEHETSFQEKYHINLAAVRTYLLISEIIKLAAKN